MVNYNLYRTFYFVAKEGNITKASERLYISQPAVSEAIRELEGQLNQKLFHRKNKGVELTGFGKILFEKVKGIIGDLDEIEEMGRKYDKLAVGQIKIGVASANLNQLMSRVLTSFAKSHPSVNIETKNDNTEELVSLLDKGSIDVAFVDYFDGCERAYNIVSEYNIFYRIIGSKHYKNLYSGENIDIEHFPTEELILPNKSNSSRKLIEDYFKKNKMTLSPKYELDNYTLLYDFVKRGLGIAFVNTEFYKDRIEKHEVEIIYPEFSLCARKLVCIVKKKQDDKIVGEFLSVVKNNKG